MLASQILDSKVVDDEGELDRPGFVFPKAWCVFGRDVAECGKVFAQLVVGDDAGLREAVHALVDFNANISVVNEWEELVLVDDFLRDYIDGESHVFVALHRGAIIKIFYVQHHVFGVRSRYGAVEVAFGCG